MKLNTIPLIVLSITCLISCTSTHNILSNSKDYLPLTIGNTWIYKDLTRPNIIKRIDEVVNVETRFSKSYFKIKHSIVYQDSIVFAYSYLRSVNDTLLDLVYDPYGKKYVEIIRAIFSLELNESRKIDSSANGRNFTTLKVTNKNDDEIVFSTFPNNAIDVGGWVTYKKGIGLIKSKSVWATGIELIEYYVK